MSTETVFVKILDKDYQVACPREERAALQESAELLDERMRAIKRSGSVIGLERIAVMAALNLSHELLQAKRQPQQPSLDLDQNELQRLNDKIDRSLEQFEQH
ncbi:MULTISPECIES: cell division protein ZapA [Marinimicrobium]|uniref:Cell division protein ZapA n=1 Tax=Marinimicrobium koreense TaxID=306545 RepID=A0A3N1NQ76_9GAMM|nr:MULTISPECIES: cell division protein ZapA [Marinimicrobium]ROQ18029.1 cell division protein ZapA [Marinimicrobium koreense]UZJ43949.1 cell division protein ZapA [Marinimicrobium sp. C6131]